MSKLVRLSEDEKLLIQTALSVGDFEGAIETVFEGHQELTRNEAVDLVEAVELAFILDTGRKDD